MKGWRELGIALAVVGAALFGEASAASAETATLSTTPTADTYVSAEAPSKSYAASDHLTADASPVKAAYLRFNVTGTAGRTVANVRLRLHQIDKSPSGGRVFRVASTTWPEALTWNTRPSVGPQLASFGAVAAYTWYEVSLGPVVTGDGPVALAIDSLHSDGSRWSSRESANRPQLLVDLQAEPPPPPPPPPPPTADGLTTVAAPTVGSSDPTYYGMQHRLARTTAGRLLTVHGRHASGVQLAWQDPGGTWTTATQGSVPNGLLLGGTGSGDWPASIAVTTGRDGTEHAWVVWSGTAGWGEAPKPVEMRHLTNLDAPNGPTVGPVVRIAEPSDAGNGRVDIGFETTSEGVVRGWLTWNHRTTTADSTSEQVVRAFDVVESDAPVLGTPTILWTANGPRIATFLSTPTDGGMRLLVRTAAGNLSLYRWQKATGWVAGPGVYVASAARPAAAALPDGAVLAAFESDPANDIVVVQRIGADAAPKPVELKITGYAEPTIAVGANGMATLVAMRTADGALVSRTLSGGTWSTADRVELGSEGGGNYQWPNALRQSDGVLRFVVRGPSGGSNRNAVLSWSRVLD